MPHEMTFYDHMLSLAKDHQFTIGVIGDLSKALLNSDARMRAAEFVLDEKHTECNALTAELEELRPYKPAFFDVRKRACELEKDYIATKAERDEWRRVAGVCERQNAAEIAKLTAQAERFQASLKDNIALLGNAGKAVNDLLNERDALTAERDALAAQLAAARGELGKVNGLAASVLSAWQGAPKWIAAEAKDANDICEAAMSAWKER